MVKKFCILFSLFVFVFTACNNDSEDDSYVEIDVPTEIAERAYKFAELYAESDTTYVLGGQDSVRSIAIDCSGLVIMCYKYAMVDTKYQLLESDMSANYMYQNASRHIEKDALRQGDLLFMGEEESNDVTHIAIFDKIEDGYIYFIDSTQKENIDGVTHRSYDESDKRFKAFGIMRVKY